MSNNDLYCHKCNSHHHPAECPIEQQKVVDEKMIEHSESNKEKIMKAREKSQKLSAKQNFSNQHVSKGQAVFSSILFPINEDIYAVNQAVLQLLDEGWKLVNFDKYEIVLKRKWEC